MHAEDNSGLLDKWTSPDGFMEMVEGPSASMNGVQHNLLAQQGLAEVEAAYKEILPTDFTITKLPVPALEESISKSTLFGYASNYTRQNYETDYLGSVRMLHKGSLKVLAVHPSALRRVLRKDSTYLKLAGGAGVSESANSTFSMVMANMNFETMAAWGAPAMDCPVSHATVAAGESLYMPPGWISCVAALNGVAVSGFKKLFLTKVHSDALITVKECADGASSADTVRCVDTFLNSLVPPSAIAASWQRTALM